MKVDTALKVVLDKVTALADKNFRETGKNYAELSPELFLYASMSCELFTKSLEHSGGDSNKLQENLLEALESEGVTSSGNLQMSSEVHNAMDIAGVIATTGQRQGLAYADVLFFLVTQYDDARYYLENSGADLEDFFEFMYKACDLYIPIMEKVGGGSLGGSERSEEANSYIKKFTIDMIEQAKKSEEPLVGREAELDKTVRILCRKSKANPIHVGEPGVGKTTIILGLAKRILKGKVPEKLKGYEIYSLDTTALMAGSMYRGDTENRVKCLLDELSKKEKVILYIDEIHNLIGSGSTGGSAMDLASMFKTALTTSNIKFIGTTTYDEYRKFFEKDKALSRRFKCVEILEPSEEDTKTIINGILPYYEKFHGVTYTEDAVDAAIELTVKYVHDRFLPDKAIDMIDEAGAYFSKDNKHGEVTRKVIEKLIAESCRIPIETVSTDDSKKLLTLADSIKKRVFGQDEAIDECVQAIKLARSGLQDDSKPVASLLFVGQTGVGKTEIAKQLASNLGVDLIRFDMSEYADETAVNKLIGASAGYVGYEDGGLLVEEVRKHPNAVLLLDELEKAHPKVFNVLLQVMDNAELTDNKGRKADFKNVIIIMTSNAGASGVVSHGLGFGAAQKVIDMGNMRREVEKTFTPEFRNRLTKVIVLNSMDDQMATNIVTTRMKDLTKLMQSKGIKITYGNRVLDYLKDKGVTEEFGARELIRVVNADIKMLFVDGILMGTIKDGSVVRIRIEGEKPKIVVE